MRRAVFLDLNGTVVLPLKVATPSEYSLIPGVAEAVAMLCDAGFLCPVITVQSRIEKGLFTEEQFRIWFRSLQQELSASRAFIEGPFVCPHRFSTPCQCKKATGSLYRRAAMELGIDVSASFVIGDSGEDMEAARSIGSRGVLVRTGWPVAAVDDQSYVYLADNLPSASRWVVGLRN